VLTYGSINIDISLHSASDAVNTTRNARKITSAMVNICFDVSNG